MGSTFGTSFCGMIIICGTGVGGRLGSGLSDMQTGKGQ